MQKSQQSKRVHYVWILKINCNNFSSSAWEDFIRNTTLFIIPTISWLVQFTCNREHLKLFNILNFVYLRLFKDIDIFHEIHNYTFYINTLESSSLTFTNKLIIFVWLSVSTESKGSLLSCPAHCWANVSLPFL